MGADLIFKLPADGPQTCVSAGDQRWCTTKNPQGLLLSCILVTFSSLLVCCKGCILVTFSSLLVCCKGHQSVGLLDATAVEWWRLHNAIASMAAKFPNRSWQDTLSHHGKYRGSLPGRVCFALPPSDSRLGATIITLPPSDWWLGATIITLPPSDWWLGATMIDMFCSAPSLQCKSCFSFVASDKVLFWWQIPATDVN